MGIMVIYSLLHLSSRLVTEELSHKTGNGREPVRLNMQNYSYTLSELKKLIKICCGSHQLHKHCKKTLALNMIRT
jgi:hypothetical protein